ncbi:gasdermin-D [Callorhinchus milii]|uniref:Gasdermin-D-like n=1 Tax=Callorhinchus milii TaxID=7868 RepID=V9KQX0_CALMI|nr:gasdermin-D [Callorhinchus milii]|eukprot:gi/632981447/ref/XP_007907597.1/ PREDICTED: gasdermin-D-like [Callorhinchus milii]
MFKKVAKRFVSEIDSQGRLIPATSVNESEHFYPLHLLHRRTDGPFWRKPRYEPIHLEIKQIADFQASWASVPGPSLGFQQMENSNEKDLKMKIKVTPVEGSVHGSSSVSESTSLLTEKLSIDVIEINESLLGRKIKKHQDYIERNYSGKLYIVTEALVSKEVVTLMKSTKQECDVMVSFSGAFELGGKCQKSAVKSLEIPEGTVIAYKVWELTVMQDKTLCLSLPQIETGLLREACAFAADAPLEQMVMRKYDVCRQLSYLESSAKPQLLDLICQIIEDFEVCSFLEDTLCDAYDGINPVSQDFDTLEASSCDRARALLDWLGILREYQPDAAKKDELLQAVCLLVGAIVDLPSAILPMLVESLKMELIPEQFRVVRHIVTSTVFWKMEGDLDAGSMMGDALGKTVAILKETGVELERADLCLRYRIEQTGGTRSLWELDMVLYSLKTLSGQ